MRPPVLYVAQRPGDIKIVIEELPLAQPVTGWINLR